VFWVSLLHPLPHPFLLLTLSPSPFINFSNTVPPPPSPQICLFSFPSLSPPPSISQPASTPHCQTSYPQDSEAVPEDRRRLTHQDVDGETGPGNGGHTGQD
jgi:hypothetical protein